MIDQEVDCSRKPTSKKSNTSRPRTNLKLPMCLHVHVEDDSIQARMGGKVTGEDPEERPVSTFQRHTRIATDVAKMETSTCSGCPPVQGRSLLVSVITDCIDRDLAGITGRISLHGVSDLPH